MNLNDLFFHSIFNWSVPFMSYLTCLVLFLATTLLYFFPLRYLVLIWGEFYIYKHIYFPKTVNELLHNKAYGTNTKS